MPIQKFDPFEDRLSRDIRNTLSKSLMKALDSRDLAIVEKTAGIYLHQDIPAPYLGYIRDRLERYRMSLDTIRQKKLTDPFTEALALWDNHLFFEVHERLEKIWMTAEGDQKKALQAMIRAAGFYIHLAHGNTKAAHSMADKAASALNLWGRALPNFTALNTLVKKLHTHDPVPPELLNS
ncbi:MAG: DUF309 domain-containing protein [Proteobacteria bacterium]|nr:DUF309 domain-containing protein [Pseudomonadota bacterium]MBU1709374.1 DUF309 domain-containing protein [Pseudomonadota bacterium]